MISNKIIIFACIAFLLSLTAHFLAYYEIATDTSSTSRYSLTAPTSCIIFILSWYWFYQLCSLHVLSYPFFSFTISSFFIFCTHLFFSLALIVNAHTDIQTLLISRRYTLFLIPVGWITAFFHLSSLSFFNSIIGSLLGYALLHCINVIGKKREQNDVLGDGDKELLAFIGSFTGVTGCWFSLLYGSYIGSVIGIMNIFILKKAASFKIPFGTFLSIGTLLYLTFHCTNTIIIPK